MSKEYLEALNGLFDLVHCQDSFEKAQKYFDIIEEALNRLEAIEKGKNTDIIDNYMAFKNDNAEYSEALEKLEECAYAMKDLPMSNWCDLANSEAELDEKIFTWVEEIKFELFKGKQALLKAQTQELNNGGRLPNKEILYLKQSLEQCNDKPIFYVSRTYGNKYIVTQKFLDDLTKENARNEEILQKYYQEGITLDSVRALKQEKDYYKKALEIIKEKNVNMFGFKRDIKQLGNRFTYKYYQSNLGNYHSGFDIQELTEEEFNLLKEVLK